MILLPLMTTWMWFQIFTASPLPSSGRLAEHTFDTDVSFLRIPGSFERG
jgi:hypothetical protein